MKGILLVFCLLTYNPSDAQFNKKIEKEVGYFIHHKDYKEALRILNQASVKSPDNPKWNYLKAKVYFEIANYDSAFVYFLKTEQLGNESRENNFYLAKLYHQRDSFAQAKEHYIRFLKVFAETDKNSHPLAMKRDIQKRIDECNNGIEFKQNQRNIEIINLGAAINSSYPDYAPVISADEQTLFFTSRRPNSTGGLVDARDGWNMEDIYICVKDSNNVWSKPEQLPGYINSNGHDANIGLSPDGQSLFIYRDDALQSGLSGNIYESVWKFRRWSTPFLLPEPINTEFWETGVSTTPDEQTLYFSSNRPGGYGGLDIYKVRMLPNGSWALPENLGPSINTEYNEESPFIHPDAKTLYFSSQGHSSMGGFDIFYSSLEDSTWTEPENMGYPLNTAQNELYFVLSADARRGYFSGIRSETYGDKDLYIANLPEKPVQIILLKGRVVDKETEKPLATLIKVFDNATKELIYVLNSNGVNGRFSSVLPPHKNYNVQVEVEQPGYAHYSVNIHIPDQKEFVEIDTIIRLQRDDTLHTITLLPNIFFKLNLAELDSTSELELDALAKRMFDNPEMNLEIAVHTFSQKNNSKNLDLSQRRANAIKQALISRGVAGNRIFPVGYGDKYPMEEEKGPWENKGITPDDRVEAIIIPSYNEKMKPADDGYYYINAYKPFVLRINPEEADMYTENTTIESENDSLPSGSSEKLIDTTYNASVKDDSQLITKIEINDKAIEKDSTIKNSKEPEISKVETEQEIPNLSDLKVYFVVNKIYFRADPDTVLNEILNLMNERPDLNIVVHSYTDTVGHPDYNKFLSKIRADNVKKALVKKGADPQRIITKGNGQINPIASNATRQGRMKNRRAEFEAIKRN